MTYKRKDNEPPLAIAEWGWRYHHTGIPVDARFEDDQHLPQFGLHVAGFSTSPFGIEWMRFDPESPVPDILKRMPHVAFEVDDLDVELSRNDFTILTPPNSPGEGTRVAIILHNGAPIELIEFEKMKRST
jgi:hypothetical protein